jgi:transcriptional regulator with XRE-family HTH domain
MTAKKIATKKAEASNTKNVPSKELKKLGDRIRKLRIAKGYKSHEIFAYTHNFPRAQYGRYERGQDIRYSSLLKITAAFDMTLEEFFSEGFDK